jgi:nucleoside-diphosphate-sugar epimerase
VFRRTAASQQRRLFGGPLVPGTLARPGLLPVVPDLRGLVFQVLHTEDAADAFHRAALRPVRGAFNVAADPVVDGAVLAELLGARRVRVPVGLVRAGLATAWRLHLVPASPELFDAVLRVPVMDTGRARTELGWTPRHTATDALAAFLTGLREGAGDATPPLEPGGSGPLRRDEFASGVGNRP